ncbi:hypothetical protein CANARDRAFT_8213 [[Candida] arabinofermentans NRRL YB-2248]|uniref:Guanine nucleotide-binding protein alpha-2 subunit n=1 Tax=[Candida] arabinofermentans NRRL YB-2248 TaxID=983967 RepID=A0A1E4SZY9_9ASCO|nr:hypothetical protein CANARDRAFT_8213 [[Candida] arabinofermentans NRRL YB-2248]
MGICGSKEEVSASNKLQPTTNARNNSTNNVETNNNPSNSINSSKSSSSQPPQVKNQKSSNSTTTTNGKSQELATTSQTNGDSLKTNGKNNKPKQEVKMLLLGSGESGKSTILKQIKIIHQNGFTRRELYDYKPFVFKNISECAQSIVKALRQFELEDQLQELSHEDTEEILNLEIPMDTDYDQFDPQVSSKIKKLVSDPLTKKLMEERRNEFYILDSAKYFFENLDRITGENYIPNVTDVLRTRKQTSGIYDIKFQLEDIDIHLYDVGGQRSERKKWIHCFDNVTVIMFCVALSEYDQVLLESSSQNRLEESLNLFESVVNSMWFRRTSVVLCLNKIDVFIEKLPNSPLENYFPDYVGGNDVNKAVKYLLWRFRQLNRADLNIMPYVTQATDTSNIKLAFAVVKETIIHNALMDSGILQSA